MRTLAALIVTLALLGCVKPGPTPPNILLVSIDSLRSDHLGSYGYPRPTSPNLDRLAAGGARFTTAIAPTPWTLPSHVTLLTGTHPEHHGVVRSHHGISSQIPTLAEVLAQSGYRTAGFVSGPYLQRRYGHDRGFDEYDESLAAVRPGLAKTGVSSPDLVTKVSDWIEDWRAAETTHPFFIFLHMWDVHYDFAPPPPYDTLFDPDYDGAVDGRGVEDGRYEKDMPARDLEHLLALYDGEIRFTDEHLGVLFDRLRSWDLLDDTIIVITADHGEEFFEHGKIGHAMEIYEESLRIPLLIHYPRQVEPLQVFEDQVRLMDVATTILGLAGVTPPREFGMPADAPAVARDLSPWLRGDFLAGAFPELIAYPSNEVFAQPRRGIRTNRDKLVRKLLGRDYWELYDLERDPGEQSVRKGVEGDIEATIATLLALEENWDTYWDERGLEPPPVRVDGQLRQQLEALGYLEATDATEQPLE